MSAHSRASTGGGGRIVTQNPGLLDMLRERTNELQQQQESTENVTQAASDYKQSRNDSASNHPGQENIVPDNHSAQQKTVNGNSNQYNPNQRKFYVNSPAFTKEDEEQYKFVNPDDLFSNELDDSLDDSEKLQEPDSVEAVPSVAELAKATSALAEKNTQSNSTLKTLPSDHVDTVNGNDLNLKTHTAEMAHLDKPYHVHDCSHGHHPVKPVMGDKPPGTEQFEKLSKMAAKRSGVSDEYETHVIEPIHSPLKPIPDEQTEELRLLEEEQRYQQQLQQRIQHTEHASQVAIPRLDLDEVVSDDDDQKQAKKSQVISDSLDDPSHLKNLQDYEEHHHILRGSVEPPPGYYSQNGEPYIHDSLDVTQPNGAADTHQLQAKYEQLEERLAQLEAEKQAGGFSLGHSQSDPRMQQLFDTSRSEAKRMTSSDLKNLQNPGVQAQYRTEYEYIEEEKFDTHREENPTMTSQNSASHPPPSGGQYRGNMPLNFGNRQEPLPDVGEEEGYHAQYANEHYANEGQGQYAHESQGAPVGAPVQPQYVDENAEVPIQQVRQEMPLQQGYANEPNHAHQYANQPYEDNYYANQAYGNEQYAQQQQQYANQQPYAYANQPPHEYANQEPPVQAYATEQYANEPIHEVDDPGALPVSETPVLKGYRSAPEADQTPGVDYVEQNKRALREEVKSASTYGKIFHKKKETEKEIANSPPPVRRKPKGSKAGPSRGPTQGSQKPSVTQPPTRQNAQAPEPENGSGDNEATTAEQLWAQRSKTLASSKERRLGSQQKKPPRVAGGNRKDSGARGNTSGYNPGIGSLPQSAAGPPHAQRPLVTGGQYAPPIPQNSSPVPHTGPPHPAYQNPQWHNANGYATVNQMQPRVNQMQPPVNHRQAAPIQSQPLTHNMYTDDGQRVSVDLNVKMMNPDGTVFQGAPNAQVGALTQQNIASQYAQPRRVPQHNEHMQLQSVTNSASSAGERRDARGVSRATNGNSMPRQPPPPQQYGAPPPHNGAPQQWGAPQWQHAGQLPRQPEGAHYVGQMNNTDAHGYTHQQNAALPQYAAASSPSRQDPRYAAAAYNQAPSLPASQPPPRAMQPAIPPGKQGFTKYSKPPPAQPMPAFEHYQNMPQEPDPYYDGYEVYDSSRNISGMSSPTSYRGAHSPSMSPYRVVPPISSAEREARGKAGVYTHHRKPSPGRGGGGGPQQQHPVDTLQPSSPTEGGGGGSYMDQLKNKKRDVHYKQYTLKDYRNLKKEIRLGGLGPNTESETVKEKREKLQRQLNYARSINDRNRSEYEQAPVRKPRSEPSRDPSAARPEAENPEEDLMDRRKLALEYAKSVPKPKVKPRPHPEEDEAMELRNNKYKYVTGRNTMRTISTMQHDGTYAPSPIHPAARDSPQHWPVAAKFIGTHPTNTAKTTTTLRTTGPGPSQHPGAATSSGNPGNQPSAAGAYEFDLEALQQRHQADKEKAALIRQNIQGSVAT